MGDNDSSDEVFARIVAGLEISSTFACTSDTSTTTTTGQSMASAAPVHTTYVAGAQHHEVHPDDPEYEKIKLDLEKQGLVLRRLVKLTHTMLAEMFQTEADHLVKMRPEGFSLNIQYLYHGTKAPFEQICDEGLDERLSRSGRFGRGIYFSDNPQKCCKYAHRSKDESYLLRCKVIMGDVKEYPVGSEDRKLVREPTKTVKDGKRVYYDSVKGQPRDHTEYVIYDRHRALIEYVIFYSKPSRHSLTSESGVRLDSTELHHQRYDSASQDGEAGVTRSSRDSQRSVDEGRSRSTTPESGSSSPMSGRSTPGSDVVPDDVFPVTYEPVKQVSVVRRRSQPATTQTGSDTATAAAVTMATAAMVTAPVTTAPSVIVDPRVLSSEVYTSPQSAALRYLLDMKGKLSASQLASLTMEYHRTYGALAGGAQGDAVAAAASSTSSTDEDPVREVMSQLIKEFKEWTHCTDDEVCRKYIEMAQMDLNRAVELFMDTAS